MIKSQFSTFLVFVGLMFSLINERFGSYFYEYAFSHQ
jgi:hypothetical protein